MITKQKLTGAVIATTVATLLAVAPLSSALAHSTHAKVHCEGVNACKGKSACKGSNNACKGQNSCKGKGFLSLTEKQCKKAKAKQAAEEAKSSK